MTAAMRGEPDAELLAELTGPRKLTKAAPVDPVLGLVGEPRPANVPIGGASPEQRRRATQAYAAAGVELPAALEARKPPEEIPERKEKVGGWYGYPSNLARIRAAWFHTQTEADGWPSLSEMTEQLLLQEAARLEADHNGGQPFPEVPAGKVRHSRRPGS